MKTVAEGKKKREILGPFGPPPFGSLPQSDLKPYLPKQVKRAPARTPQIASSSSHTSGALTAMANFGQTKFGQTEFNQNQIWPNEVGPKFNFGQKLCTCCAPNCGIHLPPSDGVPRPGSPQPDRRSPPPLRTQVLGLRTVSGVLDRPLLLPPPTLLRKTALRQTALRQTALGPTPTSCPWKPRLTMVAASPCNSAHHSPTRA